MVALHGESSRVPGLLRWYKAASRQVEAGRKFQAPLSPGSVSQALFAVLVEQIFPAARAGARNSSTKLKSALWQPTFSCYEEGVLNLWKRNRRWELASALV